LIAPVTVGRGAYVGSGSTLRGKVPAGALAVSAGRQRTIEDWVADRQKKREARTVPGAPRIED
jgi:bifunctional UDP-N-acetylglucosamine pyrophosphorylase/glucosamine-1-phosphate N-acetyltransferase